MLAIVAHKGTCNRQQKCAMKFSSLHPIWFTIHNASDKGISWPSHLQLVQCTHPTCLGPVEQPLTGGNSRYEWHVVLSELDRALHHSHPHWGEMHLTSGAQYLPVLILRLYIPHTSHHGDDYTAV